MADDCDIRSVTAWLVGGAPTASTLDDVLQQLCERLTACGLPLWRVALFVRTLHPQVLGRRLVWRRGEAVTVSEAPIEFGDSSEFRQSTVGRVFRTGVALRRRLLEGAELDSPVLRELHAEGVTDYLASPLPFTGGEMHVMSWTTRAPQGFSPAHLAAIEVVLPALVRLVEIHALRRVAITLVSLYVGHESGGRILAGQILLGHSEAIRAVLWLSDMRGFTRLADRVAPLALIELLNRYFACQVPAIEEHGGEVLKFMGDGLLAIFPLADERADAAAVCGNALAAARAARAGVAELTGPAGDDAEPVRFGLALHLGDVLYGNVGAGSRLDFTCIGPAVNYAARLEKLAGALGRSIVASEAFAERCGASLAGLGEHELAGFAERQRVYGLLDEAGKD